MSEAEYNYESPPCEWCGKGAGEAAHECRVIDLYKRIDELEASRDALRDSINRAMQADSWDDCHIELLRHVSPTRIDK